MKKLKSLESIISALIEKNCYVEMIELDFGEQEPEQLIISDSKKHIEPLSIDDIKQLETVKQYINISVSNVKIKPPEESKRVLEDMSDFNLEDL